MVNEIENQITIDHDHDKYITTQEFKKIFSARLAQANLATKSNIDDFVKNTDSDDKLKTLNENVISNKNELS